MCALQGQIALGTRSSEQWMALATPWLTLWEVPWKHCQRHNWHSVLQKALYNLLKKLQKIMKCWFEQFRTLSFERHVTKLFFSGSKNSPYLRLLPPAYGDGVFLPRFFHLVQLVSSQLSFYQLFQGRESATCPQPGLPELSSLTAGYLRHNHGVWSQLTSFLSMRIPSERGTIWMRLRARQTPTCWCSGAK